MATFKRWDGAAWQDITTFKRWDGAAWQDVTTVKRWDGASWVDCSWGGGGGALSVTANKSSVEGVSDDGADECPTHTSESVTVTASGGTGPYTYSWTRLSGASSVFATASTAATTAFEATICFGSRSAVFRCTVTDSLSATATVDISVSLP